MGQEEKPPVVNQERRTFDLDTEVIREGATVLDLGEIHPLKAPPPSEAPVPSPPGAVPATLAPPPLEVPVDVGRVALTQVSDPNDGFLYLSLRPTRRLTSSQVKALAANLIAAADEQGELSLCLLVHMTSVTGSDLGTKLRVMALEQGTKLRDDTMRALNQHGFNATSKPYDPGQDPLRAAFDKNRAALLAEAPGYQPGAKEAEEAEQDLEQQSAPDGGEDNLGGLLEGGLRGLAGRVRRRVGRAILGG